MQINGGQLATAFSPKSTTLEDRIRTPVTIDIKPGLELNDKPNNTALASAKTVPPSQASIRLNDQQQAGFVRFFSANDLSEPSLNETKFDTLPKGVQQYLKVEATSLESQQNLLDETV
jgi:hypothetical protein